MNLTTGHWVTLAISAAAMLGIADLLRDGPRSSSDLAQVAGTNPRTLYRLLRALASVGIFGSGLLSIFGGIDTLSLLHIAENLPFYFAGDWMVLTAVAPA